MWEIPVYKLKSDTGKKIEIDVTLSCSPGLGPSHVISEVAQFFTNNNVNKVLDFGAGNLRHTFPLLKLGFSVCAVEFEQQFSRSPDCRKALEKARRIGEFSELMFPNPFIANRRKFDAALLCFVLPTMPREKERKKLLDLIQKKLEDKSYIFWMSQFGKYESSKKKSNKVEDGWFWHPQWKRHPFYTEFTTEAIDKMLRRIDFHLIKRFQGNGGHDQFRLYSRGGGTWP